jgi:cysteine desulfurase / selenocysteine lyase
MNVDAIRSEFPVFQHHPTLVYADNAATTQKLQRVIEAVAAYEKQGVANIHRGMYLLAEKATRQVEETREKVARFIGAPDARCIAFTKGTTESINAVAYGFLHHQLKAGDEVVITGMEHHANLIPWQRHAVLKVIPVDKQGDLVMDSIPQIIGRKTKLLALTHISNTLGTVNPIKEIIAMAHEYGVPVLIDAAQSFSHSRVDVRELKADFLAFSAHKMFGPFGVGVLYVDPKHWESMTPFNVGGGAIRKVTFTDTEWMDFPRNMEAGTPNVSGVIGFSSTLDFLETLDWDEVSNHTTSLGKRFREGLAQVKDFQLVGDAQQQAGIVSFVHERIHPHDVAFFLTSKDIAVRAGHHCTQPLLDLLGIPATVRASFTIYNREQDVDQILEALSDLKKFWT